MQFGWQNKVFLQLFTLLSSLTGLAQGLCPPNIDFERGNFSGWECSYGKVTLLDGLNYFNFQGYGEVPGRHTLIPKNDLLMDPYGLFPQSCPNGSGFSVKLGNSFTGADAEKLLYYFTVPDNVTKYSIFFHYAVVFQDPNHPAEEQPRFRARLFNTTDNSEIPCVSFDFTASASLPGFRISTVDPSVVYKDWTPITINLTPYAGKSMILEFTTSDCTRNGHFGYAYVDVSSTCNGAVSGATLCPGDVGATLTAPYGFASYTWYSDLGFSTVLSTAQTLVVDPAPAVGTVYPVVIVPFAGFGCQDTVFATIELANLPRADAGPDKSVCSYNQVQLGSISNDTLIYSWSPPPLINITTATPLTPINLTGPTTYYLQVESKITGCENFDTVLVTPVVIDTTLLVSGEEIFCRGDQITTRFELTGTTTGIQWYRNNAIIPGAIASQLQPQATQSSEFWASISNNGCLDSTRRVKLEINPIPIPWFVTDQVVQCMDIPAYFINKSTVASDDTLSYLWRFSDGSELHDKDVSKVFNTPGPHQVMLRVTSESGCKDSTGRTLQVREFCYVHIPTAFTPNSDGKNDLFKPFLFGIKKLHRFAIFNRYGQLVYSTNFIDEGWDGKIKGVLAVTDVYVWMVEYDTYEQNGILQKGTVTLIR